MEQLRRKSPRSPSFSLKEALERALKIYEKEGRHAVPADVAAQDLGYKDAQSGAARTALATIRQFGLIIKPKEGHVAVARQVESYKFAPDEKARQTLVREFVKSPAIYRTLIMKFADHLPSDAALRFEFISMGFQPAAVDDDLKFFKQSVEFSGYYDSGEFSTEENLNAQDRMQERAGDVGESSSTGTREIRDIDPGSASTSDRIPIRLAGGRKAWLEIPSPLYEADKTQIKAQIDLILTDGEAQP